MASFDVVVVGGGTAGSVLASRLSEREDFSVLLLEAGPVDGPPAMGVPSAWGTLRRGDVDWAYSTVPQAGLDGSVFPYPAGKVLGGSSSINALIYLRAHPASYDAWESLGARGWGHADLLPYFRRAEDAPGRDERYRGVGGPMRPSATTQAQPLAQAALEAFQELGYPISPDLNAAQPEGASLGEMSAVAGVRQSAADAYLRPVLDRPNLTVLTNAQAHQLVVSGGRCVGVRYARHGEHRTVEADEVVLSAGVIGSAHLLQLSGIGPAELLASHGVEVVADLPGVGRNLSDHPLSDVVYSATRLLPESTGNHVLALAALRTDPTLAAPDLHLLCLDVPDVSVDPNAPRDAYSIVFSCLQPRSRGTVRLASNDPEAAPLIDPAILTDEADVAAMVHGLRLARELGGTRALAPWRKEELHPGPTVNTAEQLRAYLRERTITYFHGVGTCRIGSDPDAVVDPALRVHGIVGLRVADASVMPSIPAANTTTTVLAIAERAATIIAGQGGGT